MGAAPVQKSPALRDYILKAQNVPTNSAVARFVETLDQPPLPRVKSIHPHSLAAIHLDRWPETRAKE